MAFLMVAGLGSPRYGKKAVALINERRRYLAAIALITKQANEVNLNNKNKAKK